MNYISIKLRCGKKLCIVIVANIQISLAKERKITGSYKRALSLRITGSRFIFLPYGYLINPTSFIEAFSLSFLHHSDTFVISQVITYVWVSRLCFIDLFVYLDILFTPP